MTAATNDPGIRPSVYFSRAYGEAVASMHPEGTRWISITRDNGRWQVPLLIIPLGEGEFEAVSPYGYAGIYIDSHIDAARGNSLWLETLDVLRSHKVISLFLRFSPLDPAATQMSRTFDGLQIRTVSQTVAVPTTDIDLSWAGMAGRARTAVRKARKAGLTGQISAAEASTVTPGSGFRDIYEATMRRIGADEQHIHSTAYYDQLLDGLGERILNASVTTSSGAECASALIFVEDDVVHYHLSGSDPVYARMGANNLLLWTILSWAVDNDRKLVHLGGGTSAADSLFQFKKSFGGVELDFAVGTSVIAARSYERRVRERAASLSVAAEDLESSGYFPAFRAHGVPR